jgi:Zn-dependent protease
MIFIAGFGWAKPVPVNPFNLRGDRNQGMMLVSLAGPATNMIIAVLGAFALRSIAGMIPYGNSIFVYIIYINIVLAIFNLLPIPPLDGSKILAGLWPGGQRWLFQLESYGTLILLLLLFTGIIGKVLGLIIKPIFRFLVNGLF